MNVRIDKSFERDIKRIRDIADDAIRKNSRKE